LKGKKGKMYTQGGMSFQRQTREKLLGTDPSVGKSGGRFWGRRDKGGGEVQTVGKIHQ